MASNEMALSASVVVPTYQRTKSLEVLLDSLLAQSFPKDAYEIVVSDDGSGPAVERCVRAYMGRGVDVRWESGPNAGPGVARNRGAKVARGEILAFIDDDEVAPPEWLALMVEGARAHGSVYGPVRNPVPSRPPFVLGFSLEGAHARMATANLAVSRAVFEQVGGFDPKLSYSAEDWDMGVRLRDAGFPPKYLEDAGISHPLRVAAVPRLRQALQVQARDARGWRDLCRRAPHLKSYFAAVNRRALVHGGAKAAVAAAFVPLAAAFPPALLGGWAVGVGLGTVKWRDANRVLAEAGEDARVPWSTALRWGLQWPVSELLLYAVRASVGMGFIAD